MKFKYIGHIRFQPWAITFREGGLEDLTGIMAIFGMVNMDGGGGRGGGGGGGGGGGRETGGGGGGIKQ